MTAHTDTAQQAAIQTYRASWKRLRSEARSLTKAAKTAPGPLTAARLRTQAYRADQAALTAYRAAWAEEHPEP